MQPHPDTSCPPSHLPFMKETGIVRFPPECGPSTVTAEVKVPSEGRLTPGQGASYGTVFLQVHLCWALWERWRPSPASFQCPPPRGPQGSSKVSKIQYHPQGSWLKSCLPSPECLRR